MVRAGVVDHPSEWELCGYNEIPAPRQRYALIDYDGLRRLLGLDSMNDSRLPIVDGLRNRREDGAWTFQQPFRRF